MKKIISILITFCIIGLLTQKSFAITNDEIREQAKILYLGNQNQEAQKRIMLIPTNQRNAEDYFIIGNTEKDLKTAIKAYEQAIKLDDKFYQAYYNIGSLYLSVQNYDKAIEYFTNSIKYKKEFAYGYYNLGCTYLKKEQFNSARKCFEAAIKLNPEEPDYYYNLGYTYKKMNNLKRSEKAINLYNELIKKRNDF